MKRYRLPAGTEPGAVPTSLVMEHRDPMLTHTYMALHTRASLAGEWGPFTPEQLRNSLPDPPAEAGRFGYSVETIARDLQRLADLGYVEVEYLA